MIYIATSANKTVGSGHLVRGLIIYNKLFENRIPCKFLLSNTDEKFLENLKSKQIPFSIVDFNNILNPEVYTKFRKGDVLITDGDDEIFYYSNFQNQIRNIGVKLITITFSNEAHFYSDVIHNQNLMAPSLEYSTEQYTKKLLGGEYMIMDDRFSKFPPSNFDKKPLNLLLYFGSSDQVDRTSFVLENLKFSKLDFNRITVVTGLLHPDIQKVKKLAKELPFQTKVFVQTDEMPSLMYESKFAITSGGLAAWELATVKTGNIIIPESEREVLSSLNLKRKGLCAVLPKLEELKHTSDCLFDPIISDTCFSSRVEKFHREINPSGVNRFLEESLNWN